MKKLLFITILLLFISKINAQTLVVPEKMNVFYAGIENPVSIVVEGIPDDEVEVKISEGTITKKDKMGYVVLLNKVGNIEISIFHKGQKYQSHIFRVKRLPNPTTNIFRRYSGCAGPRGSIKDIKKLELAMEDFEFDVKCSITNFHFSMVSPNKNPISIKNIGAVFSSEVNAAIQNSKIGDIIYFDEVKARCPGDLTERTLNSLLFHIKYDVPASK